MSLSTIDLNLSPRLYGSPRESTAEVTKEEGMSMAFETVVNNEQLDELASRWQWVNWKKHDKTNLLVGIMIIISLVFAILVLFFTAFSPYKKKNWAGLVTICAIVVVQSTHSIVICIMHHLFWKPERVLVRKIMSITNLVAYVPVGITFVVILFNTIYIPFSSGSPTEKQKMQSGIIVVICYVTVFVATIVTHLLNVGMDLYDDYQQKIEDQYKKNRTKT